MSRRQMAKRVFISHSLKDFEVARHIAQRLRAAGLEPIGLENIEAGRSQKRKALRETIRESDAAVFLITPSAMESDWTMVELGLADGFDKEIVPVVAGLGEQELPAQFQSYKAVPFHHLDSAIQNLARRLTKKDGRGTTSKE